MVEKNDINEFDEALERHFKEIILLGKNVCCVCHHELGIHVDEGDIWRCHSLAGDGYQCECVLRKNRAENKISYYDLSRRAKEHVMELKKI